MPLHPLNRIATLVGATFFGLFGLAFAAAGVAMAVNGFHRDGWGVVAFSAIFVLIGLVLAAAAVATVPMQRRAAAREAANPNQPWLWSGDWNTTTLVDRAGTRVVWIWVLAIAIDGHMLFGWRGVLLGRFTSDLNRWTVLPVVAAGIALLGYAVAVTRRYFRYGRSVLELDPFPGQVGGRFAGTLWVSGDLDDAGPITLRLTCSRVTSDGEGTSRTLLWEDEREARAKPWSGAGSEVPVEFNIPADQPSTGPRRSGTGAIEWRLQAKAVNGATAGYRSRFEVPVFVVPDPQPPMAATAAPVRHGEPPEHPGITLTRLSGGGCSIHFAAGRDWRAGLFVTALAAVLIAGGLYMPRTGAPIWPQLIVWLFAVLLTFGAAQSWLASGTVTARSSGLSVNRGLPLLRRHRDVPTASVTDVVLAITGQAGRATFYDLHALTPAGRVTLARTVRDKRVAEWVSSELLSALGNGRPR